MTTYVESVLVRLTERQSRILRAAAKEKNKTPEQLVKYWVTMGIEGLEAARTLAIQKRA